MNDPGSVRFVEPVRDLNAVPKGLLEWQGASLQPLGKRVAFDVLHNEEVDAVLISDIVERADMRVVELRDDFGFALEALLALRAFGEMLREHFDGNGALKASVFRLVHLTPCPRRQSAQRFRRVQELSQHGVSFSAAI